jgi:hypothetical protein
VTVVVPAPDEPVMAMTGCLGDMSRPQRVPVDGFFEWRAMKGARGEPSFMA